MIKITMYITLHVLYSEWNTLIKNYAIYVVSAATQKC